MPANHTDIEQRLWDTADELRANSKLKASEYSVPVLGLIFFRFADHKFTQVEEELTAARGQSSRRTIGKTDYQARGVLYFQHRLASPHCSIRQKVKTLAKSEYGWSNLII